MALTNTTGTAATLPLDSGDISWILISSALVFVQIPGLALFYSGLSEAKNSLVALLSVLLAFCVVFLQWVLFGYSLALSDTSTSKFIGNFDFGACLNILTTQNAIASTIPAALLAMYQGMFAGITPGLFLGAVIGRIRLLPMMFFVFLWTTIVYDPITYWSWSTHGWLHTLNVMDYAGGSVVHLSAGVTGLVLALMLGNRSDYGEKAYEAHNPTFVYIGTILMWFGWMGFNGGSSVAANVRGVGAAFATNIAAAAGGLSYMALEQIINKKRFSAIAFCNGVVVALVAITPGSGFVQPSVGIIFGSLTAVACFVSVKLVHSFKIDDGLEVAASHGVGGAFGMVLTGIFAQYEVTTLNVSAGSATAGWLDQVWIQVPVQFAGIASVVVWTVAWTVLIVLGMNAVPGLRLRCSVEEEAVGLDASEIGEHSYPYISLPDLERQKPAMGESKITVAGI
ncbi:ammonium transporter 1 [Chytriomyces cf. hyalinus JEL632]|nr:ammonium transporter 1 [Chytriomyces cf. hyalinus JEL632]